MLPAPSRSPQPATGTGRSARRAILPSLLAIAGVGLWGCTINYHTHHRSPTLCLHHNAPDGHPAELDPLWAEMALQVMADEFGVELARIAPVDVFIDCESIPAGGSHFNRLTKSVVLREGQAPLTRLFIHEITHLLLDEIDGSPPYWVDQGLAEYMESRVCRSTDSVELGLAPPYPEAAGERIRSIGQGATGASLLEHLSPRAVDNGWSWSVPVVHYLLTDRWASWPLPSRLRRLVNLSDADLLRLLPSMREYCRRHDPVADFVREFRRGARGARLLLLADVSRRCGGSHRPALDRLLAGETDSSWRRTLARWILLEARPEDVGKAYDRLAGDLAPDPIPELGPRSRRALARHLVKRRRIGPEDESFPLVAGFLARYRPEEGDGVGVDADTALAWFTRWPMRAVEFARRPEIRDRILPELARADRRVLVAFLAGSPLCDFEARGVFAAGSTPGHVSGTDRVFARTSAASGARGPTGDEGTPGALVLTNRVELLGSLDSESRRTLAFRLGRLLEEDMDFPELSRASAERVATRAAALRAYLGGSLEPRWLDPLVCGGDEAIAFTCAFLPPAERAFARRHANAWLESRGPGPTGLDRLFRESPLGLFAAPLGLAGFRALYEPGMERLEEGRRSAFLLAAALFGDPLVAAPIVDRLLGENPIGEAARLYVQLTTGRQDCVESAADGRRLEVRLRRSCLEPLSDAGELRRLRARSAAAELPDLGLFRRWSG